MKLLERASKEEGFADPFNSLGTSMGNEVDEAPLMSELKFMKVEVDRVGIVLESNISEKADILSPKSSGSVIELLLFDVSAENFDALAVGVFSPCWILERLMEPFEKGFGIILGVEMPSMAYSIPIDIPPLPNESPGASEMLPLRVIVPMNGGMSKMDVETAVLQDGFEIDGRLTAKCFKFFFAISAFSMQPRSASILRPFRTSLA